MSDVDPKTGMAFSRIVCAAIRNKAGEIIISARHFDPFMHNQISYRFDDPSDRWRDAEQGFIDQFGIFFSREEAWVVATQQNQIFRRVGGDNECLYSENLY